MNEPKHTPGPWRIAGHCTNAAMIAGEESTGRDIAIVYDHHEGYEANARLISAAPEMLEALRMAKVWIEDTLLDFDLTDNGTLEEIVKAITKAEGE